MLTLEQASAVNDGFHRNDLNAALAPLESTIDLRANELPRLDKKAIAALKNGLKNGDDAATWAQAILHPNISVRRFARKIFIGLGDEAAPIFEPLRARLERFWNEEEPLPETSKPREAALRREQTEQVSSALEILLRADPERFMAFYAQLADNAPAETSHGGQSAEVRAWSERNQAAYKATQAETTRLIEAEWGAKFADYSERWKLPSRVLREMDERARQQPEIAGMWVELGANPFEAMAMAPAWHPHRLLMNAWNSYLTDYQPTGPTLRVTARLWLVLWNWIRDAFDFERDFEQRAKIVRRMGRGAIGYRLSGRQGREQLRENAPILLLDTKAHLLPTIQALLAAQSKQQTRRQEIKSEWVIAELWISLAQTLGNLCFRPHGIVTGKWEDAPNIEPETLRALAKNLTVAETGQGTIGILLTAAKHIEAERAAREKPAPAPSAEIVISEQPSAQISRFKMPTNEALAPTLARQIYDEFNNPTNGGSYGKAQTELERRAEEVARQIIALDETERLKRLVKAPHPSVAGAYISRGTYLSLWTRDMKLDEAKQWQAQFFGRVETQLWARLEEQLDAHRRLETEPIEPDIKDKLTERETKEWRARVRREKREVISRDAQGLARQFGIFYGIEAQLRAIALADRPGCRGIRDEMEKLAFAQIEIRPSGEQGFEYGREGWRNWTLDEKWDPIIEKLEARWQNTKDGWERNNLERQLATGYYRRGNFAAFERHAVTPDAFAHVVSMAAAATDNFEVWRVLVGVADEYQASHLKQFWEAQLAEETQKARAIEAIAQMLAVINVEKIARNLLNWIKPLSATEFEPHLSEVENALESALPNVKKWAMQTLSALPDAEFDRERAAQTASESLWSENAGLAKDAAKFLSVLALRDSDVAATAWDALDDASALENIGLCEAVYRALVKIKAKCKSLELSEAAREKLELLSAAQRERFEKFGAKLNN